MIPPGARAARIGVALLALAFAAVVRRPHPASDVSVRTDRLSELAVGSHRGFMIAAFVLVGAGLWAVGLAVAFAGGHAARHHRGAARGGRDRHGRGRDLAHRLSRARNPPAGRSTAPPRLPPRSLSSRPGLSSPCSFRPPGRRRRLEAGLALAGGLLGVLGPPLHRSAVTGYSQRLLWLVLVAWAAVVGLRLATRRAAASARPRKPTGTRAPAGRVRALRRRLGAAGATWPSG